MYIHHFCLLNTSVQLQFSENLKFTLDQSEPVWFEAWHRSGWSLLSCSNPPSSRNGTQGCFSPYRAAAIYPAAITWEIRSHHSAERLNCSNPPCPPWLHLWRSLTWCRWAPASQWEEWVKGEAPAEWGWGWRWLWMLAGGSRLTADWPDSARGWTWGHRVCLRSEPAGVPCGAIRFLSAS